MVGTTGIEPVTPSMSTRCSPAELRALDTIEIRQFLVRMVPHSVKIRYFLFNEETCACFRIQLVVIIFQTGKLDL